jgi:uncharacterized protein (TIGR02594 family)
VADFDLSLAITADGGDESAAEVRKVEGATDDLSLSIKKLDDSTKKGGPTSSELRARLRDQAKAINEVVRATNPAVSSQRMLDAAVAKAGRAYMQGKISAEAYARAQEIASQATFKAANSTRQAQMGTAQLGMQINDLATQVSMGTSPLRAFSMQAGQIGWAMAQGQGKAAAFGRFLQGPWGAALLVGGMLLGTLIDKLSGSTKGTEDLTRAQELHKMTVEELTEAIKEETDALGKNIQTGREGEEQALRNAEATRKETLERRQHIVALLEEAQARLDLAMAGVGGGKAGGEAAAGQAAMFASRVETLQAQLEGANRRLAQAERNVTNARIPLLQRESKARTDPAAKIEEDYSSGVAALNKLIQKRRISEAEYGKRLDALNVETEAARKALQESNRKGRKPREVSLGDQLTKEFGESLLAAAQSREGLSETANKSTLQSLFREANLNIDPEIVKWCAAFVNSVLATKGVRGTGALNARSFLGWGDETQSPQKGDIVVLRRGGDPAAGHVGFFAGTDDKGNVRVTGGNQGNRVSTQSFARSDVLGFRRAPSGSDQFQLEERLAQDEAKLVDWAERVQLQISGIGARFEDAPSGVKTARDAIADIDKLMGDLQDKKPPNLEALLAQARAAKEVIEDGIHRPFEEFVESQTQSVEIERLIVAGREDEAEAMEVIFDLQQQIGDLLPEEEEAVRAILRLRRAEAKEAQEAREEQEKYLDFVNSTRDAVRDIFDGTGEGLRNFPKKFGDSLLKLGGDLAFDSLFGGLFEQLEHEITGVQDLGDASEEAAAAAKAVTAAFAKLGKSADQLAGKLSGEEPAPGEEGGGTEDTRVKSPAEAIKDALKKLGEKVFGKELAAKIGGYIRAAVQGAAVGSTAAGAILGPRSAKGELYSQIGGAIGGAIGSIFGPVGSVIGSVLGGLAGGLLGGKEKQPNGETNIVWKNGRLQTGRRTGPAEIQSATGSAANTVIQGIEEIAATFGGGIAGQNISVGIAQRAGKWVVDERGLGRTKGEGTPSFGTAEEAIAYAILDAIKDGVVTGLSPAVEAALKSSPDLQKAMQEALKVQELEVLVGGVGKQLEMHFRQFELVAKERLRIAAQYGFDLVQIEQINAEDRAKVLEDVIRERTGALQELLDDMLFGDLFEGTPSDQRNALLQQITQERTRAEAGVPGSTDRLADLERQLLDLSRNTFGTAGSEYATDREMVRLDAERIIALETQRAQEAQDRAIAALAAAQQQNQLTNETNNILVQGNATLSAILAAIQAQGATGATSAGSGGGGGGGTMARETNLRALPNAY